MQINTVKLKFSEKEENMYTLIQKKAQTMLEKMMGERENKENGQAHTNLCVDETSSDSSLKSNRSCMLTMVHYNRQKYPS